MDHPFEIGKEYRYSKGVYEVLAIDEPYMRVRYEDGREADLSIASQALFWKMWKNIPEREPLPELKKTGRKGKKLGRERVPANSKQEKLIAEILEDDEAVNEILTRLTIPPGQIDLYRFFLKHPDDYFSQQEIAEAIRNSDLKSERGVFMAFGRRIGASPDQRVQRLNPYNSLFFQHQKSGGKTFLRIRSRIVGIFQSHTNFYNFLISDSPSWLPDKFGSPHWKHTPEIHRRQMAYFGFGLDEN